MPKDQTPEAQKALMAAFQADRAKVMTRESLEAVQRDATPSRVRASRHTGRQAIVDQLGKRGSTPRPRPRADVAEARGVTAARNLKIQKAKEAEAAGREREEPPRPRAQAKQRSFVR